MDTFFKDLDPNLVESVEEVILKSSLSEFAASYDGPDSQTGRLRALATLVSGTADQQEKTLGTDSDEWKKTIQVTALVYSALDDWDHAASTWRKVVDIDDQVTSADHPKRDLAAMFNYGLALNHTKRWPESEEVFTRLLPMLEGVPKLGKQSQQYAGSLAALMRAVGMQGRVDEARKLYSEHRAIVDQFGEPERTAHADTAKKILSEIEHEAREK